MRAKTLDDAIALGNANGADCVSSEYIDSKEPLDWICQSCDYRWPQSYNQFQTYVKDKRVSCPKCADRVKRTKKDMEIIAESRGGRFLSTSFSTLSTEYLWECEKRHQWKAIASSILFNNKGKGSWCATCSGNKKKTFDELKKIVQGRNGEIKTPPGKYKNTNTTVKLVCWCGYGRRGEWSTRAINIFDGKWCPSPKCGNNLKHNITKMRQEAKSRGGKCLSKEYFNNRQLLDWECVCGNRFPMSWNDVSNGRWCGNCKDSREERICRGFFEKLFDCHFPSVWPEWLKNSEGNIMELDGYSEKLNIAFEYQGAQHTKFNTKFHKNKKAFEKQKEDDKIKLELCKKKGIKLIVVSTFKKKGESLPTEFISFIRDECKKQKIDPPKNLDDADLDVLESYRTPLDIYKMRELSELAYSRNGRILTKEFIGILGVYEWQCFKHGNIWPAKANDVKNGKTWCKTCGYEKVSKAMSKFRKGKTRKKVAN